MQRYPLVGYACLSSIYVVGAVEEKVPEGHVSNNTGKEVTLGWPVHLVMTCQKRGGKIPNKFKVFYIHGSVHRDFVWIRSNEMQQYAGVYLLQFTLHVSGVYRTYHQEYIKL